MARQRFIWPELWKDPFFGKLQPVEQVLFIGLFSIADDEGRLMADPAYLRAEIFPYKDYTNKKVQSIRDSVVEQASNIHLYRAAGLDYIALLKWRDYQKPKYPKASKIPPPFPEGFPNLPPILPESGDVGRVGLGRKGLGRVGLEPTEQDIEEKTLEVKKMLRHLRGADDGSEAILVGLALKLPLGSVAKVRESVENAGTPKLVGYAVNALKSEAAAA